MKQVMIVEDDRYVRESLLELLATPSRHLRGCASAEAALLALNEQAADLLITDVNLPGKSGLELTESVLQRWPLMQVLLCSGHDLQMAFADQTERVRSLRKPFEIEDLEAMVESMGF